MMERLWEIEREKQNNEEGKKEERSKTMKKGMEGNMREITQQLLNVCVFCAGSGDSTHRERVSLSALQRPDGRTHW